MRIMNENKRRNEINSIERYELFEEALSHCGKFLLNLADEDIAYHIFEEFDGDCTSFLNEKNLERLRLSSKITLEIVDMALELSSMGIRVDAEALSRQLDISGFTDRAKLPYHRDLLDGKLPLTIGGGIGQSRMCMFFLRKAHIGEVQASCWPSEDVKKCEENGILLL